MRRQPSRFVVPQWGMLLQAALLVGWVGVVAPAAPPTPSETATVTVEPVAPSETATVVVTSTESVSLSTMMPDWLRAATHLENLTSFESNCPAAVDDMEDALQKVAALRTAYDLRHHSSGHAPLLSQNEHANVPWNIMVIFTTFGVGAVVRHVFTANPGLSYFPYTVVMFSVGMIWGFLGKALDSDKYTQLAHMNPHLILYTFLPLLIFESAFAMDMSVFKKLIGQCIVLAGPGLVIASGLTAYAAKVMFVEYNWDWSASLLFGVILSATDPVAVVALLKELGTSKSIATLIEGESLLNDGTAIVFFEFLREAVKQENCNPDWVSCTDQCYCPDYNCPFPYTSSEVAFRFTYVVLGGMLVGLVMGAISVFSLNHVFSDALTEITVTICSSYVTFFVSEGWFKVSGVLALVVLGCFTGKYKTCISPDVMPTLHAFWEMVAYLANTLIFALAGLLVSLKAFDDFQVIEVIYLAGMYVTVNVIRAFVVTLATPSLLCFSKDLHWNLGNFALVTWGGLRGAIGLTLSLVLEGDENIIPNVRDKIMFQVAGIVVGTMVINGVTTRNVVSFFKLGAVGDRRKRMMQHRFRELLVEHAQDIQDVGDNPLFYDTNMERLSRFTSLTSGLEGDYVDPYNKRTERLHLDKSALYEDGRISYLNAIDGGIRRQMQQGKLGRRGIRQLQLLVEKSREGEEKTLMNAALLEPLCKMPLEWKAMSMVPGWKQAMVHETQAHAFDIVLAFAECHGITRNNIGDHEDIDKEVRDVIRTHCKKTIADCVARCNAITAMHSDVSCAIKTKHAAREVLNHMDHTITVMLHEGRLDNDDAKVLRQGLIQRKAAIEKNFPIALTESVPSDILTSSPLYENAEVECQQELEAALLIGTIGVKVFDEVVTFGARGERRGSAGSLASVAWSKSPSMRLSFPSVRSGSPCPDKQQGSLRCKGIYIIMSGIVKLRTGKRVSYYGEGYVVGLQELLTGSRLGDAIAESQCKALFIPVDLVRRLMDVYPGFTLALYKQCGIIAAQSILPANVGDARVLQHAYTGNKLCKQFVESGQIEYLLDPDAFPREAQLRMKLDSNTLYILLQGRCWEYEVDGVREGELKAPHYLPKIRFATFTEHAVLFCMPVKSTPAARAQQLWRHLRSRSRSVVIWSSLRGVLYSRVALTLLLQSTFADPLDFNRLNEAEQLLYRKHRGKASFAPPPRAAPRGVERSTFGMLPNAVSREREGYHVVPPKQGSLPITPVLLDASSKNEDDASMPGAMRQNSLLMRPPSSTAFFGSPVSDQADLIKAELADIRGELRKNIEAATKEMLGGISTLRNEMSAMKDEPGNRRSHNSVSFSVPVATLQSPDSLHSSIHIGEGLESEAESFAEAPLPLPLGSGTRQSVLPDISTEVMLRKGTIPQRATSLKQTSSPLRGAASPPQRQSPQRADYASDTGSIEVDFGRNTRHSSSNDPRVTPVKPIPKRPQQQHHQAKPNPAVFGLTPSTSSASAESNPRGSRKPAPPPISAAPSTHPAPSTPSQLLESPVSGPASSVPNHSSLGRGGDPFLHAPQEGGALGGVSTHCNTQQQQQQQQSYQGSSSATLAPRPSEETAGGGGGNVEGLPHHRGMAFGGGLSGAASPHPPHPSYPSALLGSAHTARSTSPPPSGGAAEAVRMQHVLGSGASPLTSDPPAAVDLLEEVELLPLEVLGEGEGDGETPDKPFSTSQNPHPPSGIAEVGDALQGSGSRWVGEGEKKKGGESRSSPPRRGSSSRRRRRRDEEEEEGRRRRRRRGGSDSGSPEGRRREKKGKKEEGGRRRRRREEEEGKPVRREVRETQQQQQDAPPPAFRGYPGVKSAEEKCAEFLTNLPPSPPPQPKPAASGSLLSSPVSSPMTTRGSGSLQALLAGPTLMEQAQRWKDSTQSSAAAASIAVPLKRPVDLPGSPGAVPRVTSSSALLR